VRQWKGGGFQHKGMLMFAPKSQRRAISALRMEAGSEEKKKTYPFLSEETQGRPLVCSGKRTPLAEPPCIRPILGKPGVTNIYEKGGDSPQTPILLERRGKARKGSFFRGRAFPWVRNVSTKCCRRGSTVQPED